MQVLQHHARHTAHARRATHAPSYPNIGTMVRFILYHNEKTPSVQEEADEHGDIVFVRDSGACVCCVWYSCVWYSCVWYSCVWLPIVYAYTMHSRDPLALSSLLLTLSLHLLFT